MKLNFGSVQEESAFWVQTPSDNPSSYFFLGYLQGRIELVTKGKSTQRELAFVCRMYFTKMFINLARLLLY